MGNTNMRLTFDIRLTFAQHCEDFDVVCKFRKYKGNFYVIITSNPMGSVKYPQIYHNFVVTSYFPNAIPKKHRATQNLI
jgi:hypothetical protein